jgi:hypothetical protein
MDLKIIPMLIQEYEGRPIRLSGTSSVGIEKWVNGSFKTHTIHDFIFTDNNELISFEFDFNNLFLNKVCLLIK